MTLQRNGQHRCSYCPSKQVTKGFIWRSARSHVLPKHKDRPSDQPPSSANHQPAISSMHARTHTHAHPRTPTRARACAHAPTRSPLCSPSQEPRPSLAVPGSPTTASWVRLERSVACPEAGTHRSSRAPPRTIQPQREPTRKHTLSASSAGRAQDVGWVGSARQPRAYLQPAGIHLTLLCPPSSHVHGTQSDT